MFTIYYVGRNRTEREGNKECEVILGQKGKIT